MLSHLTANICLCGECNPTEAVADALAQDILDALADTEGATCKRVRSCRKLLEEALDLIWDHASFEFRNDGLDVSPEMASAERKVSTVPFDEAFRNAGCRTCKALAMFNGRPCLFR